MVYFNLDFYILLQDKLAASQGVTLMNITFPDNAGIGKRRIRAFLFLIAACALSILYVFTENIYAAKLTVYTYNPITLYILTFAAASNKTKGEFNKWI